MNIIKTILLSTIALLPFSSSALSQVIIQDDFSPSSSGNWATRLLDGASVQFNDALELTPNAGNPQPAAAYRSFSSVALADGQTLRMTFDVSVLAVNDQTTFVRFGLGFADSPITGTSADLGVPLNGYYATLPIASSDYPSIINWVNGSTSQPENFFNFATETRGITLPFPNGVAVSTVPKAVIFNVTRSGSTFIFSGSLDGYDFPAGDATGASVLPDFEFNTVAFGYVYDGNTAIYENFTLEVIPEPSTLAYLGGLMVAVFVIKRRQVKSRA
jgi:hypothetical protein